MLDKDIPKVAYQPWHPMKNPTDIKTIGKLGEELGECQAAIMRCLIQGIDEREPVTGKLNKDWLTEEVADVLVNAELIVQRFGLDRLAIVRRMSLKEPLLRAWHNEA